MTQKEEGTALKQRVLRFDSRAETIQAEAATARRAAQEARACLEDCKLQLAVTRCPIPRILSGLTCDDDEYTLGCRRDKVLSCCTQFCDELMRVSAKLLWVGAVQ